MREWWARIALNRGSNWEECAVRVPPSRASTWRMLSRGCSVAGTSGVRTGRAGAATGAGVAVVGMDGSPTVSASVAERPRTPSGRGRSCSPVTAHPLPDGRPGSPRWGESRSAGGPGAPGTRSRPDQTVTTEE